MRCTPRIQARTPFASCLSSCSRWSLALSLTLAAASSTAACGGSDSTSPDSAGTQTAPTEPATGEPTANGTPAGEKPGSNGDGGQPPADGPITPSTTPPLQLETDKAIVDALAVAKLDLGALPASLAELNPRQRSAVMKSFTLALGTTCEGCHSKSGDQIDFKVETPNIKVTKKMWSEYVGKLKKKDGGPIYCDSCHQKKMKFLDTADNRSLGVWMKENFVSKLARKDGNSHACSTCHGSPFNGPILDAWEK